MNNRTIMIMGIVFFGGSSFLYSGDKEKTPKPGVALYDFFADDSPSGAACSTKSLVGDSKDAGDGYVSDLDIGDSDSKKADSGSIKEEQDFAFLAQKLRKVSLQPKKLMPRDEIVQRYLVEVRAAAGGKPKKQKAFEVGEPKLKMPQQPIQHIGPKAKGSLAFLSAKRRNTEKSYPGLFWDKIK